MRYLLAAFLLFLAPFALAEDLIARQGNDSVRLTDKPCPILEVIIASVPQGARGYLRLAQADFQGQQFVGCWAPTGGAVFLWYEDGDQGVIPLRDLKPVTDT